MDAVNGRGPTMRCSDSPTGEPEAVRLRVDLDGSFTGSVVPRHGQRSPAPEAADAGNVDCDELESPITTLKDPDLDVVSCVSGDSESDFSGESNTSVAGKRRRTPVPSNASHGPSGQHEEDGSERSESCGCSVASETDTGRPSGKANSETEYDGGTDAHNLSTPFGGSTHSLCELSLALDRASEALTQEKGREENVVTVVAEGVSKVSRVTYRFQGVASGPLSEFMNHIENRDLRKLDACGDALGKRLDAIKAYVSGVCTEAERPENPKSPVLQVHGKKTSSDSTNLIEDTTSDEDQRTRTKRRHARHCYTVRQASNTVRKSRNVVVRQRKAMSKLCDVAQRLVSKAEVSCQLIIHCLKTIVIVLAPAVRASMLIDIVVRALNSEGQNLPAFTNAASVTARWASEALLDAETAIRFHKEACEALQAAWWDVDKMRSYQPHGARVLSDITAAGDRFLDLVRQSDVSLVRIRNWESKMKTMRRSLTHVLVKMRSYRILIEQWSYMCSDTLSVVLQRLSLASESSCNVIEQATRAIEHVFIPAGISLKEQTIYRFRLELRK